MKKVDRLQVLAVYDVLSDAGTLPGDGKIVASATFLVPDFNVIRLAGNEALHGGLLASEFCPLGGSGVARD